jgi:hypothetical protein
LENIVSALVEPAICSPPTGNFASKAGKADRLESHNGCEAVEKGSELIK